LGSLQGCLSLYERAKRSEPNYEHRFRWHWQHGRHAGSRLVALAVENVWTANRSEGKLTALAAEFPGIHIASLRKLVANCDLIFLCLKAGDAASALAQMDPELYPGQLLITTASQIPLQTLEDRVPCRVAKLIPCITQEIGAGVALLMYGRRATADDHKLLEELLGRISHPVVIAESQSRPAIGLASGGPAFVAYLLKSMAEEAARSNPDFPPELAFSLVSSPGDFVNADSLLRVSISPAEWFC